MQNIEVEINGAKVDIDLNKIPLVFSRKIDLWEDFLGAQGAQAKSLNDTLYLPATKNNASILGNLDSYAYNSQPQQTILTVQCFVNGACIFSGQGLRVSAAKAGLQSQVFAVKVLGDAQDVFARIDGRSLRDLPMGQADTEPVDINNTQTALSATDNPLIFAPAFYGKSTYNGATVTFDNRSYLRGLRPAVRIWKILQAIFEVQLGYEIVSNLYQTEAFRNLIYPFGVGDDWERNDDVSPIRCFVGANNQSYMPPAASVRFLNESAPYSDPAGLNNIATFEPTAYGAGWYIFKFYITGININKIVLRGESAAGVVNINLGEYDPFTYVETEPILFEPDAGLKKMRFNIEGTINPLTVTEGSYYKAELTQRFAFGQPLRIASCLHDRPQKDFLRGLQHAFGLVFGIDNINKRVYIDPRFNNATQPAVVPEALFNHEQGYYNPSATPELLQVDLENTSVQHKRPFGDSLTLAYGEDSSDPVYEVAKNKFGYEVAPMMGSLLSFIPSGEKGQTIRNPFFTYLLNVKMVSSPTIPREGIMPCLTDDLENLENNTIADTFIRPSFKTAPKLAMYYGLLDFSDPIYGNYYQWGYEDYTIIGGSMPLLNTIPSFFQVFPDSAGYFSAFDDIPFILSYAGQRYQNALVPDTYVLGLIDKYHSKYLSIIYNDKWYSLTAKVNLPNYRTDLFKAPKLFSIGGQLIKGWQVSTESFNPTQSDKADVIVIADYDNIKSETYSEQADGRIPLLTIGYIFELTNNIP
jgi:hypothetical protein